MRVERLHELVEFIEDVIDTEAESKVIDAAMAVTVMTHLSTRIHPYRLSYQVSRP